MALSYSQTVLFAATCGFLGHLVFNKLEPHTPRPLLSLLLFFPLLPSQLFRPFFSSLSSACLAGFSIYWLALSASVICYRISPFHPLYKVPGPFWAKISNLWGLAMTATGRQHLVQQWLHETYGPYVRIGPNHVSVCDRDALAPVMGADGMPKGPVWDGRRDPSWPASLIAQRTVHSHTARRKRWNRAFTSVAVKDYEPIITKRALQLADVIEKEKTVDISMMFSYFTADFMGDMAFGGGFELLRDGDKQDLWSMIEGGMQVTALTAHLPWANWFLFRLPGMTNGMTRFKKFSYVRALERKEKGSITRDLFNHLIDEDGLEDVPPTIPEIISDAGLAIIAGSDTTASALSNAIYYLLMNKSAWTRLREEVDMVFPVGEGDPFDSTKLAGMEFLNAIINETLRLRPPVNGTSRAPEAGTGGRVVGPHYIPEGTQVTFPMYSLHRNPEYFSPHTTSFIPDRWLRRSSRIPEFATTHFTTDRAAFAPFSYGPANCAGKNLAMVEMRMVLALLVQRFDFAIGSEEDVALWESRLEDWFVMKKGPLPVVVTPRAQ